MTRTQTEVREQDVAMPASFLEWQCSERQEVFASLERGEIPTWFAAHLPVVSTISGPDASFPIRSCTKGVGLLPARQYLDLHTREIKSCLERVTGKCPIETRPQRLDTARLLYDNPDQIDLNLFGTIEIFRGQTFRNLSRDPRAAMLFTGPGPSYLSYQLNCSVDVLRPGDPYFEFILGMRLLFDYERFHIKQPQYVVGYLFRIQEVFEKTPFQVKPDQGMTTNG